MSQRKRIENLKRWETYIGKSVLIRQEHVPDAFQKGVPTFWKSHRGTVAFVYYHPHLKNIFLMINTGKHSAPIAQCTDPKGCFRKTEIYIDGVRVV